jgi:two-component system sensor histidine kinase RegB
VRVPPRAVAQAIRGVVKNALEASPPAAEVALRVEADAAEWRIVVRDAGPGMDRAVLARAGEPFFTTKGGGASSGRGMGLGLFLTRVVLERLGGALEIASQPGAGTAATLRLPRAALEVS